MKTNGTLRTLLSVVCTAILSILANNASALPEYTFKNAVLISGTNLQVGAKYRFSNIKPGVDGIITIAGMQNIILDELDGASGFDEAFQPAIHCPGKKKGYVEFTLEFVKTGTFTPMIMLEVPMTAIDIDGWEFPDEKICEYDEFRLSPSYYVNYSTVGSQLDVSFSGGSSGFVTATNKTGIVYDGIDTIQRDVMFSIVHASVSSVSFRVGADNKSVTGMQRLRSVYFKRFYYPNGLLASDPLSSFNGTVLNRKVELKYMLNDPSKIKTVVIERASSNMAFSYLQEVITDGNVKQYLVTDVQQQGVSYYRLKLVQYSGNTSYSNIIKFGNTDRQAFKIYPSVITDHTTVQLQSFKEEETVLQIVDYNGRIVYNREINVNEGTNNILLDGMSNLNNGNYILTARIGKDMFCQKIIKQ